MTATIVGGLIFLVVFVAAVWWQRRNNKPLAAANAEFDRMSSDLADKVNQQHTVLYGRASSEIESSFPSITQHPHRRSS